MRDESPAASVRPTTNRGTFRLQVMLWSVWSALQLLTVIGNALGGQDWAFREYLSVVMLVVGLAALGYLAHLRRRDEHLWTAEAERRADWDRRGRALQIRLELRWTVTSVSTRTQSNLRRWGTSARPHHDGDLNQPTHRDGHFKREAFPPTGTSVG